MQDILNVDTLVHVTRAEYSSVPGVGGEKDLGQPNGPRSEVSCSFFTPGTRDMTAQ